MSTRITGYSEVTEPSADHRVYMDGPTSGSAQCTPHNAARKASQTALTYAASTALDFLGASVQTISLTGNVTFTTSNKAAGRSIQVIVSSGSSARTPTFPSGWIWLGAAAPTSIAASKTGMLSLYCKGTAESDVIAGWAVQP